MSIFPKRTVPGKGVTIHWNFNTAHLKNTHIFPFIKIGVKDPEGKITMLFEGNILALPHSADESFEASASEPVLKYLNKNTPLLVLADYLSGPFKKEVIVDILSAIQSGRHYYFHYSVSEDAPLGKYSLISEVHSNGEIRYSKTASDDFFFVEKLTLESIETKKGHYLASIQNSSSEKIPVKIMECLYNDKQELTTSIKVFEMPSNSLSAIEYNSPITFLLYNEEREMLSLAPGGSVFPIRNQQLLSLSKKESHQEVAYVVPANTDESYKLEGISYELWKKADGISPKEHNSDERYSEAYQELVENGLIQEILYNK
jgi:hypothetical protein